MNHNYDWALQTAVDSLNATGAPSAQSQRSDRVEWAKLHALISIAMSLRDIVEKGG